MFASPAPTSGILTSGTVYSSRERVNVILPGTGYRGEGNNFFAPLRGGDRKTQIRALIGEALADVAAEHPYGWAARGGYSVTLGEDWQVRGRYTFTVWTDQLEV